METLKSGMAARFETVRDGFVCVRVVQITGESGRVSTAQSVKCIVTRNHGAYMPGEVITSSALHVIPPAAIRRTRYATYVRAFMVECDVYKPAGSFNLTW
jgi:hypothetical protein